MNETRLANRRVGLKLVLVTVAMFGFGYALVPLYDIICEVTGLNGRTADGPADLTGVTADESRTLTVQFMATVAAGAPWEFRPALASMQVQPGRTYQTTFFARNLEDVYPLSPMQQGMLFHTLRDHATGVYVEQLRFMMDGLDAPVFADAWREVMGRHPVLRTAVVGARSAEPLQVVDGQVRVPDRPGHGIEFDWDSLEQHRA